MFQRFEQIHLVSKESIFYLLLKNLFFMLLTVKFLGHEIRYNRIKLDQSIFALIQKSPSLTAKGCTYEVHRCTQLLHKFHRKTLCQSQTSLWSFTWKNTPCNCTSEHEISIQKLTSFLKSNTELTIPNTKHQSLNTRAVLITRSPLSTQRRKQNESCFFKNSRIVNSKEQNISNLERELLGTGITK